MLDDLLLLRLRAVPTPPGGETRSRVAADLRSVCADPTWGKLDWQTAFGDALERLTTAGMLTTSGRNGARLHLADAGCQRVRAVFQLPADHTPTGWIQCRDRYALPLALDGQPAATAEELRATLLRRLYLPELTAHFNSRSLAAAVDLLLAKRLPVTTPNPGAFRAAALRAWIRQEPPAAQQPLPASSPPTPAPARRLPDDLPAFACLALAAARASQTGKFGEHKVLVFHAWRELLAAGNAAPDEAAAFRERLARAHTAGLLRLSRADLAGAHDTDDLSASEVRHLGEKFHFIRLD